MIDLKYSMEVVRILNEIDETTLQRALEIADFYGVDVEYIALDAGLFRIFDMRIKSGYFSPSLLSSYFYCARRMWLRRIHGDIVDEEGLKRIVRGKVAQALWIREHREFVEEYEVVDTEEMIHGYIDAVKIEGERAVIVELKSSHRTNTGHRLQLMLYKKVFEKTHGIQTDAYLVYRHGVKHVSLNLDLLNRYMKRVKAVLESDIPPPPIPERKYCDKCPYRIYCSKYPVTDWDEWLVGVVGDLPKGEKCVNCPMLYGCRSYRARSGKYPCEAQQVALKLTNTLTAL